MTYHIDKVRFISKDSQGLKRMLFKVGLAMDDGNNDLYIFDPDLDIKLSIHNFESTTKPGLVCISINDKKISLFRGVVLPKDDGAVPVFSKSITSSDEFPIFNKNGNKTCLFELPYCEEGYFITCYLLGEKVDAKKYEEIQKGSILLDADTKKRMLPLKFKNQIMCFTAYRQKVVYEHQILFIYHPNKVQNVKQHLDGIDFEIDKNILNQYGFQLQKRKSDDSYLLLY